MPLSRTADLISAAARTGHGVAAFNAVTLEHLEAIADGAECAGTPVIVQFSENAVRFHGGRLEPLAVAAAAVAEACSAPVGLHLDHVEDVELLKRADGLGISSVMVDASKLPYEDNVAATRAASTWAHERNLYVEAELGEVGGKDGAHAPGVLTDAGEAAAFVAATGVDALAIAVGSSHAMTERTAALNLDRIAEIAAVVAVPLVLHGSSGVPDRAIADGVRAGLTKINVSTHLNTAFTAGLREYLDANPAVVDPRKYLGAARTTLAEEVQRLIDIIHGPVITGSV